MILDILDHALRYASLTSRFANAFEFLKKADTSLKLGRHEIDGDNVFALVQKYTTKPLEKAQFEVHRKYIDVQFVHSGRETILWAPLASLKKVTMPYTDEQDAALFSLIPDSTPMHLSAGHFAILYPEDGHAPCCVWDAPCEVCKVVVKVRV
jgi:biofilm protein TabA